MWRGEQGGAGKTGYPVLVFFSALFQRAVLAVLVALAAAVANPASARRPHRPAHHPRNMPPGWTWPPNAAMRADGAVCLARLDALGVTYTRAPPTPKVTTPVYVPGMELGGVALVAISRKGPHVMDCQLARALADGGGAALRAAGVRTLRFSSVHALRNVAHTRILSRHALGLAMDVYELVGVDGTIHVVARDYPDALLLDAERRGMDSRVFRALLTPGNDSPAHRDHFHFEARSTGEVWRPLAPAPVSSAP